MTGELTIKVYINNGKGALECHSSLRGVGMTDKMMMLEALMRSLHFNEIDRKTGIALLHCGGFHQLMQRIGIDGDMSVIDLSNLNIKP